MYSVNFILNRITMYFYSHRINSLDQLKHVDKNHGVEIDLRDYKSHLILSHDPFPKTIIYLEEYLPYLMGRNIIANIKSERVEKMFVEMKNKLAPNSEYFFLDSSFSMISNFGLIYNFASRFSEFESLDTSINLVKNSLVKWLWIDTFFSFPINKENINKINSLQVKKCFTSPDLLGRENQIPAYAKLIKDFNLKIDAICCKNENISLWERTLYN